MQWLERNRDDILGGTRSALASLLVHVARVAERTDAERAKRVVENENAIESIVRSFGKDRVSVVHLPVRSEVERGAYNPEARQLVRTVRALGADYFPALRSCAWEGGMFYRHDDHPNAAGYARVSECVAGYLRQRIDR